MSNIGYRIQKEFKRPDPALIRKFAKVPVPNIGDCMNRTTALGSGLRALTRTRMMGTAYTVNCPAGNNLLFYYAIDNAKPGDVIVVANHGYTERALCGEIMATMAKKRGLAGFVIDGAIVDSIGLYAITAFTAATRVEGFVNSFGSSICQSCSVFTAQNMGVGARQRVKQGFRVGMRLALAVDAVTAGAMFFFASPLIGVLLSSPTAEEITAGTAYLKIVAVFYLFCFIGNVFVGYYRGIGQAILPFAGTTLHITVRVLLSWLLTGSMGLSAVGLATGIGWVVVAGFHTAAYTLLARRETVRA